MKYYKYSLVHSVLGTLNLTYAPQEWSEDQAFWERSMTYWGIFRKFSTKELTFIKSGCDRLKAIFDTYGTEAVCQYVVEVLNTATYTYSTLFTGLVDFSTYKYVQGNSGTFVKVQIIDNSFINKIKTREAIDIALNKLVDCDGVAITAFSNENTSISIPQRVDTYTAEMVSSHEAIVTEAVTLTYNSREDESIVDVLGTDPALSDGAFFKPAYTSDLTVTLVITGSVAFSGMGAVNIRLRRYDSDGNLESTTTVFSETIAEPPETITVAVNGDFDVDDVREDDYVTLGVYITGTPDTCSLVVTATPYYTKVVVSAGSIKGYAFHEAFTRICQSITGQNDCFTSGILGRTDSQIISYAVDGALSLGILTNGLLIRGFSFTDADVSLKASLKNLFLSLFSIYPIGLGLETVSGVQRIRVEEMQYFFDDTVFLTIEGATDITEEVASDLTFSSLKLGFAASKSAYNEIKGRYEYNKQVTYTTPITSQQNEHSSVSPYRADTNGIVFAASKRSYLFPSEDTEYDDDNFLINFVRPWTIARDDNYSLVGGVDNPTGAYNLDYQPGRNLRRWGSFIRGFLEKYTDKILSFSSSEKNSQAYSQRTGETAPIYEGVDVNISDLDDPWFENIYYSFNCVITPDIITALEGSTAGFPNYYKLVAFRNNDTEAYKYGWIMKVESRKPDQKGMGQFKLLKKAS